MIILDKYELINILRAAADGIEGRSNSKEIELKFDNFRHALYTLCKVVVMSCQDVHSGFYSSDAFGFVANKLQQFDNSYAKEDLEERAKDLYKKLTLEEAPKE